MSTATVEKKEKSCKELIRGKMEGRLQQMFPDFDDYEDNVAIINDYGEMPERDEPQGQDSTADAVYVDDVADLARELHQDHVHEIPLEIDHKVVYTVLLGCGGPHDEFQLDWEANGWTGGRYIYRDWFDGATEGIGHDQAEEIAELFGIYPEQHYSPNH